MIIDKIENIDFYGNLDKNFKLGFDFIISKDLDTLECGRYELSDEVYVNIQEYDTKLEDTAQFEAHLKYADIQYIISGEEKLGYLNNENFEVTTEYNEENDIVFGNSNGKETFFTANKGDFLIFFPQDAHKPSIAISEPSKVKKLVVKVKCL